MAIEKKPFACRNCGSLCPIVVTLDGQRVLKVEGDHDAPLYRGYTCPKGRAIPQEHHRPGRLLQSLKRLPDGSRVPISSEQLVEEIAAKLSRIIDAHGPQSVAAFLGNGVSAQSAASGLSVYDPGGGLRAVGVGGAVTWKTTDRITTSLFGEYAQLQGPAAASSLVKERGSPNQFLLGVSGTYRFDFSL